MTPEGRVKMLVKRVLDESKAYHHWPVVNGMGAPTLDCIACYRGRYLAIETKAPGKKPTERQVRTISQIAAAGGKVLVIDGDAGIAELKRWLHGS